MVRRVFRACVGAAALVWPVVAARAETCRFTGTTSHGGQAAVTVQTAGSADDLTVDVTLDFRIDAWFSDVQILAEEISSWRGGELQRLGVNQRTVINGTAKKQQWDMFVREGGALSAYRVQAKRLAEFQQHHPGFVRHWTPASFGQPWLQDYAAASPERRPDLDLPHAALAQHLRSPLAFAFYWSRFLPGDGGVAPMFLPGFKRDAATTLAWGKATDGPGWRRWQSQLEHPGLDRTPPSLVAAWVSPTNYLLQLGLDVHASAGSGQATLQAAGCQGLQIAPAALR